MLQRGASITQAGGSALHNCTDLETHRSHAGLALTKDTVITAGGYAEKSITPSSLGRCHSVQEYDFRVKHFLKLCFYMYLFAYINSMIWKYRFSNLIAKLHFLLFAVAHSRQKHKPTCQMCHPPACTDPDAL